MIHVTGLRKQYSSFIAVDDVSFSIQPGQICGLVGHNGAGKTTTMRCLAGLLRPDNGDLRVAGFSSLENPVGLKRNVVFIPDDPPLFDDLRVQDHFEFIGRIYEVEHFRDKAAALLDQFGLTAKRNDLAGALSRGMRQKLAICLAYLIDPRVLLFDEPMTGLDPPGIRLFLQTLCERAALGTTVLLSSHLLAMIQDVCNTIIIMHQGQLRFVGPVDQLQQTFPGSLTLEQAFFAAIDDQVAVDSDALAGEAVA